jgi:hypothetical protein
MQRVKVTAVLMNPDGVWDDSADVNVPDNAPPGLAAMQVLAKLLGQGGLISMPTADTVEFIPMARVKDITIKAGGLSIATGMGDIRQAAAAAASVQRIKV